MPKVAQNDDPGVLVGTEQEGFILQMAGYRLQTSRLQSPSYISTFYEEYASPAVCLTRGPADQIKKYLKPSKYIYIYIGAFQC